MPSIDDPPNITRTQQDQALSGESDLSDGSESLFSMYLNRTIPEDREMVESWKADADKILVFVGHTISYTPYVHNVECADRCILCYGRGISRNGHPKYSAELAGHLRLLSCKYLPASFYPTKWVPSFHPVDIFRPHRAIYTAYNSRLGQCAFFLESCHQSDLCPIGDIGTAVGASLSKGCLPTLQPPQASTSSCIL